LYFGFLHGAVSGPVQVLFLNKNGAGSFLAISVPMIIARVLSTSPKHRRIWLALAGVGILALLLTGSRGAWLGVVVALGVLMARRGGKFIAIYIGTLVLLVLAIATIVPPSLTRAGDFAPSVQNGAANTILIRGVIWRDALNLIASHPVLGMGVGGYISYDTYNGDPINFNTNDPHNAILYMWAELGPLGLLVFLWMVYSILWLGVQADHNTKDDPDHWIAEGSFSAITSYLVFALSEPIWVRGDGLIFFLLVGICASLQSPTKLDETTGGAQGAIIGTPSLGQFRAH
ncbi:MAG: polymerase, partial [Chloroflexi bacterium]|nr:polymerase [Chloroflexota bacterium]